MPSYARREIVNEDEISVYHCMARCVRQAFLCGFDAASDKNFDHRKAWIENRLENLASIFAVEIASYAVMSNHLHLILRLRPDIVQAWTDQEVATRAARLSLCRFDNRELSEERLAESINALAADPERIEKARKKLKSLSWFMRYLCESISRRVNAEEAKSGRFWDGRFRSVRLLDEAAMLTCSMYVDLNPIRAKLAQTPEESKHTSAYDRIKEMQAEAAGGEGGKASQAHAAAGQEEATETASACESVALRIHSARRTQRTVGERGEEDSGGQTSEAHAG